MLTGKKVLVIGLARSGKAAVKLLQKLNATITINEGKELEKIGFKKNNSGKYENEDGSIVIEMKDDAVSSISMNSECKSEFHGIKIGDEREKIEKEFFI